MFSASCQYYVHPAAIYIVYTYSVQKLDKISNTKFMGENTIMGNTYRVVTTHSNLIQFFAKIMPSSNFSLYSLSRNQEVEFVDAYFMTLHVCVHVRAHMSGFLISCVWNFCATDI
jgi:hypothetical protein